MQTIIQESAQNVNSNAGICLARQVLDRLGSLMRFDEFQPSSKSVACQTYSNAGIVKAQVALMTLGKSSYCDIAAHQRDDLFADAIGEEVPSEPTFRQRIEYLADIPGFTGIVDDATVELLSGVGDLGLVRIESGEYLPIDIDVSVLVNDDCRKEGVGFTYHRIDGYAPIFCTIGTRGYQLANELRPGTQHSQKGFPEFLDRCIALARRIAPGAKLLVRLDCGHDADETLAAGFRLDDEIAKAVEGCGLAFVVKRNARHEDERTWIEQANGAGDGPSYSYRDAENGADVSVFRGTVSHLRTKSTADRPLTCVWEVKRAKKDDELFPDYSTATWWTNLADGAETVVRLYHDHATCEQFHSELKTDMGVERLPSGSFKVNSLVLALSALAFDILRLVGQTALAAGFGANEKRRERIRLRTVLLNLMYVAAIDGGHGGRRILRLGRNCRVAKVFIEVHRRLAA